MKKYVVGLLLLIAHNACAMELEVINDKKTSDVTKLLEKHSRKKNQKRRIDLLPIHIHTTLPFDLQKNIFTMMHQMYEAQRERFMTVKINGFKHFIDIGNKHHWAVRYVLKYNYQSSMKHDLCQLLNKAEKHAYLQKNNKDKFLEGYGKNYIVDNGYLLPMELVVMDMTETITSFVEEYYNPIIMLFWYIKNKKLIL